MIRAAELFTRLRLLNLFLHLVVIIVVLTVDSSIHPAGLGHGDILVHDLRIELVNP